MWWEQGGRTDLDNLLLVCTFHHKLVHEYGWTIRRAQDGTVRWFHPDGTRYRAGPAPPDELTDRQPMLSAGGQLIRKPLLHHVIYEGDGVVKSSTVSRWAMGWVSPSPA